MPVAFIDIANEIAVFCTEDTRPRYLVRGNFPQRRHFTRGPALPPAAAVCGSGTRPTGIGSTVSERRSLSVVVFCRRHAWAREKCVAGNGKKNDENNDQGD